MKYFVFQRLDEPPPVSIRPTDLLYGPAVCVLHQDVLDPHTVQVRTTGDKDAQDVLDPRTVQVRTTAVTCSQCGAELGHQVQDTVEIWTHSVVLTAAGTDKLYLNPDVRTAFDNLRVLLFSRLHDQVGGGELMPRFLFAADRRRLTVWVVDKCLELYTANDNNVEKHAAVKVLYAIESTSDRDAVGSNSAAMDTLPTEMMEEVVTQLNRLTDSLPDDLQPKNGWQVAYLL